jgi:hypothetical protein
VKPPFARVEGGEIVPMTGRRTLGSAGRAEMLELWDQLGANRQKLLLDAARIFVEQIKPLIKTGRR